MTCRQKEGFSIRKIASVSNLYLLFIAIWTTGLFNLVVMIKLGLGKLRGGLIELKEVSAFLTSGRKQTHLATKSASE